MRLLALEAARPNSVGGYVRGCSLDHRPCGRSCNDVCCGCAPTSRRGSIPPSDLPLTLSADAAADLLGILHRDGRPYGAEIRTLYRSGRFPAPIDAELPVRRWRWSRRDVLAYGNGEWRPS
jgi:hypothetical protein